MNNAKTPLLKLLLVIQISNNTTFRLGNKKVMRN